MNALQIACADAILKSKGWVRLEAEYADGIWEYGESRLMTFCDKWALDGYFRGKTLMETLKYFDTHKRKL